MQVTLNWMGRELVFPENVGLSKEYFGLFQNRFLSRKKLQFIADKNVRALWHLAAPRILTSGSTGLPPGCNSAFLADLGFR